MVFQKGHKIRKGMARTQGSFKKGNIPWNKGTKGVMKPNKASFKKGIHPKTQFKKGFKHTEEWKRKMSLKFRGAKSHLWKGGLTKINHLIRDSFENRLWIKYCMERDNYTCCDCKIIGGQLEVHHIKPFSQILKEKKIKTFKDARQCAELWDLDNGITFCKSCHMKIDRHRKGKILEGTVL